MKILPTVVLVGASYQLRCDQRKADFEHVLGYLLAYEGYPIVSPIRPHGIPVDWARNLYFEAAIESKADIAICCDSDMFVAGQHIGEIIRQLEWMDRHQSKPLLVGTYLLRDGVQCTWTAPGVRPERWEDLPNDFPEVYFNGGGWMVHNLNVYRKQWPKPPWFKFTDRGVGEDAWHCFQVKKRTGFGPILYPPRLFVAQHAPQGAAPAPIERKKQ